MYRLIVNNRLCAHSDYGPDLIRIARVLKIETFSITLNGNLVYSQGD